MQTEIEAKFLNADHSAVRTKLRGLGATCTLPFQIMKRTNFDYADLRLDKKAAWVRVRQEGDKTVMAFKQRLSTKIDGMREIEFSVSDYDAACTFMLAIGLRVKAQQETKREVWDLGQCEVMLDEWPWIPPYVEVEGPNESAVRAVAERLGFDWSQAEIDSADGVYQRYFDVTRTEISTCKIAFGDVPDWLETKRKPAT